MPAVAIYFALIGLWMKASQHRWWWYEPRFRIKTARLSGGPAGAEIWGWVCLSEYICVPQRPWQFSWACILALTSCSLLYANSSFVCWQAHWQLHVGWGKAPVRIIHGASAAPQTTQQQMENAEKCGLCVSNLLFGNLFYTHSIGTCHMNLGNEVCTAGPWGWSLESHICYGVY